MPSRSLPPAICEPWRRWHGISAPPVANARVLELGCAAGNLLPYAVAHPEARAVGVDLSVQQIEAGQSIVKAMGLKNLDLRAMSITDITPEFGQFDYIIVHGVFSWVPPEVREAILRVCRKTWRLKVLPMSATTPIQAGRRRTWCGMR